MIDITVINQFCWFVWWF